MNASVCAMGEGGALRRNGLPVSPTRCGTGMGAPVRWLALAALTLLGACAGQPSAPGSAGAQGKRVGDAGAETRDSREPAAEAAPGASPNASFEKQQLERATLAQRQGRLAEAALAYEVLTVLRPDVRDYRERLADTRRQIEAAVAERLPRAVQAQKRGELDAAAQQYLGVLALAPDNDAAADGLRAVERERNKRNFLGKYSRLTLTRRAMAEAEVQNGNTSTTQGNTGMPVTLAERNEIEHASMLAAQGEVDEAIGMLEKRLAQDRRDEPARLMLADLYFQKAEKIVAKDKPGAIAALERSLKLDAANARAAVRLRQLKAPAAAPGADPPAAPAPAAPAAPTATGAPVTRGGAAKPASPPPKPATSPASSSSR